MAEETQYTAKTKMVTLSSSSSNMNGTGSTLIISGGTKGTLIKKVYFKAQNSTTSPSGIIRLFIYNGSSYFLIKEIDMPPITQSSSSPPPIMKSFETWIELNFTLSSSSSLYASYQSGSSPNINIIAEGIDWSYYTKGVRADTTQYTFSTNSVDAKTANPDLNGSTANPLFTAYTAGSSGTYMGSSIKSIIIKSSVGTSPGMVRIWVQDLSSNKFLLTEISVPIVQLNTDYGVDRSFEYQINFNNYFNLQAGYSILASTQNTQDFNVIVEGKDWNYAS